jgi:glycosyltransferase involved in cell wall biosynthesis
VLVGSKHLAIPDHPRIRHLGFLSDEEKFDAIAAADVLVMPSPYESLSMVTLEAWALAKPVLVNGACDVLRGQCVRSGGGLYYETVEEFCEGLFRLEASGPMGAALGRHGRDYYRRHYSWPVIEQKYLNMLDRLAQEPAVSPAETAPGVLARRFQTRPPARDVLATLPSGPVVR